MKRWRFALRAAALIFCLASAAPASDQQDPTGSSNTKPAPTQPQVSQHRHHLIEVTSRNWQPLTPNEKFELFWRDPISWEVHLSIAVGAGIAYATDNRSYLGTGWQGYGKRYGINLLDEVNTTFMQSFLLPVLFHEEPRYIPNDTGTTRQRIYYSLTRVAIARKDSGGFTINKSKLLGELASSSLSLAYDYPRDRNNRPGDAFARAGINLGTEAAFNLFKEFWPDFARKIKLNVWMRNFVRSTIRDTIRID